MTNRAETNKEAEGSVEERARDSRRRLIRGGLAAAPVLMTLANRPAFGANGATPSAFGSINASRPDTGVEISGRSPGYWKNHTNVWPAPFKAVSTEGPGGAAATKFDDVFTGSRFPGLTLLDVISPEKKLAASGNGGDTAVARCCVAALLNAASGKTIGVLDIDQVKIIWTEFVSKGYFSPTHGVKWYGNYTEPMPSDPYYGGGIIGYLETTWT